MAIGFMATFALISATVGFVSCRHVAPAPGDLTPSPEIPVVSQAPLFDPAAVLPAVGPARAVWRHSVVPGGVFTRDEVWQAVMQWPEVERHYGEIQFASLEPTRLEKPQQAHVSYKKNEKIYWTTYAVNLDAGEMVLTDGKHMIRARCGNRLSFEPREPVLPHDEPAPTEMETFEVEPPAMGIPTVHSFGLQIPHFIPPVIWMPDWTHHSPTPPGPPVTVVPEFPSWCYLALALAFMAGGYVWTRRRRAAAR